jgi:hypothetical protein
MTVRAVALCFLASLALPSAQARSLPQTVQYPSCLCGADFNRDGRADRGAVSSDQGATFVHLWLSGKSEPVRLRVGKSTIGVFALDVDRDGNTDLVALKANLQTRVWLNDGHGEFVRRSRHDSRVSFESGMAPGQYQPPADLLCPSSREDGMNVPCVASAPVHASSEQSEARGPESGDPDIEDSFLDTTHPRGPPAVSCAV